MAKNDNAHSVRLADSLDRNAGHDFAEGIFSRVFQQDVKVTLRESIKVGADKCVIEVEW